MSSTTLQHTVYNVGGEVSYDGTHARPTTATVSGFTGGGSAIFEGATATVSPIATTLNDPSATKNSTVITLASGSDVNPDDEFWVRTPDEKLRCKTKSTNDITLWAPLQHTHATGVTVEGTRLSYTVTAAQAAQLFWDGHLAWYDQNGDLIDTQTWICTKYPMRRSVTAVDLIDEHPKVSILLASEEDPERLLDRARQDVLKRLAAATDGRAHTYPGPEQFNSAILLSACYLLYRRRPNDKSRDQAKMYDEWCHRDLTEATAGYAKRDGNQNGVIEQQEQRAFGSIRLRRS